MNLIHILGLLDIISGFVIIIIKFGLLEPFGLFLSILLTIKSLVFIKNVSSVIDLITAVFFFLASIGFYFSFCLLNFISANLPGFFK